MTEALVVIGEQNGEALPVLFAPNARTAERVIEFFTAHLRNQYSQCLSEGGEQIRDVVR